MGKDVVMSQLESLEQLVRALSPEELATFRAWFLEFDWQLWDEQVERDSNSGKLDELAAKALREHAARKTTPL